MYGTSYTTGTVLLTNNYDTMAFITSGNSLVTRIPGIYTYTLTGAYDGYLNDCFVYLNVNGEIRATLKSTNTTGGMYEYEYHTGTNNVTGTVMLYEGDVLSITYKLAAYNDGNVTGLIAYNGN